MAYLCRERKVERYLFFLGKVREAEYCSLTKNVAAWKIQVGHNSEKPINAKIRDRKHISVFGQTLSRSSGKKARSLAIGFIQGLFLWIKALVFVLYENGLKHL